MKIIKKLFRNLGIFLLAILASLALFFVIKHPDMFWASVLDVNEISLIEEKKRDIAYKQQDGLFDIFFAASTSHRPITLSLVHHSSIFLDEAFFSGQCASKILEASQDNTFISLDCPEFDARQSILLIPFSGNADNVLLEEGYYFDGDTKMSLSVGNLSEYTQHGR